MLLEEIPVIDLGQTSPAELAQALMTSSCALITGHGVAPELIADMVRVSRAFFDQPRERKAAVRWPGAGNWRGWLPVYEGTDDLNSSELPELLEKYEIQLPRPWDRKADADALAAWAAQFDFWPTELADGPDDAADFRTVWTTYYAALGDLADRIVLLLAEAFDLPAEELGSWTDDHYANLGVNNYLDQPEPPVPGQVRIRQHTDIGGLTLLWADSAPGGLEVRFPGEDTWTAVQIPEDCFLIQAGELLARWTNDLIQPNIHRVANPPVEIGPQSRRTSIVYFHYPELSLEVRPAPSCVSEERPAGTVLAAGAHLRSAVEQPKARHRRLDEELATR